MNVKELTKELGQVGNRARFVSITYRAKKNNELARYTINVGFDYEQILIKSLAQLQKKIGKLEGIERLAANEVYDSILNSLQRWREGTTNDNYTKKDVYSTVGNGIRVNLQDGSFELTGYVRHKKVLEEGTPDKTKSSEKTIAKRKIRKQLPLGKFRSFSLDAETVNRIKLNKKILELETKKK